MGIFSDPEKLKIFYEKRNCYICEKIFYVSREGKIKRGRPGGIRPRHAVTCSKKCSREKRDLNLTQKKYFEKKKQLLKYNVGDDNE